MSIQRFIIKHFTKILICLIFFIFQKNMIFAQDQAIQVSFSPKSKKVKSNEIASLLVKITNNSHQTIKGIVYIQSDFTILTKNNQEISIEPQSDLFLPVKVHVNQNPAVDGKSFVTL